MAQGTISKRSVDALVTTGKTHYLWDNDPIGFGVRVTPGGAKSYIYQFRMGGRGSPVRREVIGRVEKMSPEQARDRAHELAHLARIGTDPIEKKHADRKAKAEAKLTAEQLAFDAYCQRYIALRVKPEKLASVGNIDMVFRLHTIPQLGSKPLPDIAKRDVVAVLDAIPPASIALRRSAFAILNRMFNWAVGRGDLASNPMSGMKRPPAVASRDRVLTDDELALALRAAAQMEWPFGPLYQLLFATGQRREEVAGLSWHELDRGKELWMLPRERSKNDEANIVPLNRLALAVLDRLAGQEGKDSPQWPRKSLIFSTTGKTTVSGFSRAKRRLDALMATLAAQDAIEAGRDSESVSVDPWRLHDARRTLATGLQRLGVRFEVTEAVLNHTSGASRSGVAAVYQRHDWGSEKREALDLWSASMHAILAGHRQSDHKSKDDPEGHRGWQKYIAGWVKHEGPPPAESENVLQFEQPAKAG
jgi:integrase